MRIRWWQSIRGRMALGSVVLILLTSTVLALTAIIAIFYFYEVDRKDHMSQLATSLAGRIGASDKQADSLGISSRQVLSAPSQQSDYVPLVVKHTRAGTVLAYPAYPGLTVTNNAYARNVVLVYLVKQENPPVRFGDVTKLSSAVKAAFMGQTTVSEFGQNGPLGLPQPYVVSPIFQGGTSGHPVVGVLILTPRTDALPSSLSSVGMMVLIVSLSIAVVGALAAIFFSRTITRPLAKMSYAAHTMQSGNYSVRVETEAQGELGALAHTFNNMASQLERDVEELRRQEVWRRELIMSITHDLATPLTAIAGLGEALVDGVNQSREDYEETGLVIVRETLRLRRLVKDLHVMAKMEAGALSPQCQPVRLAALVDEVLAVLTTEFERAQVEPDNQISYSLPSVYADPDMLTRVFSNLCDNALRYTPPGGCVTINAEQIRATTGVLPCDNTVSQDQPTIVGATTKGCPSLLISVTDTGKGISPDALDRVFERFFRADGARQSATGGSGLGLAIVRAIIEAHGGKVWVENVPEGGARISFTVPTSSPQLLAEKATRPL
ncbi:MAG TPA: HAMP domain-containing sensor histidine kinase [Ktedonobacteraceae bacterium]|jgi:signal transduction histidine kinase